MVLTTDSVQFATSSALSRRTLLAGMATAAAGSLAVGSQARPRRIPVVLDTDIGDDIDDSWALGLLLRCPELDPKLILTDYGKPEYRARIVAKFLTQVGRDNLPIGLGVPSMPPASNPLEVWTRDFPLEQYHGTVHPDGVQALIDVVMHARERVTILAIGPAPNLAAALQREPRIAERANVVGMFGSVRRGYSGKPPPDAEYNVACDVPACRKVFTASWPICITPLDTCGVVHLRGEHYQRLLASPDRIARTVLANYEAWDRANSHNPDKPLNPHQSSTLFDTVAVYLAATQQTGRDLLEIERLSIRVNDAGFTREEAGAKEIEVATEWKNLDGFQDFLVDRLTHGS